ncbi:MAG: hypothetical protein UCP83_11410 [Intestinibacter bartlettii]|nr:hypothetical protein [Intestinibacter bartlettii]
MDIMNGFTFPLGSKDVFVKTSLKNKTEGLARKILLKMGLPENPNTRKEILYWLQKATCEIKTLSNGRKYYEIAGENFGGRGSFVDDGKTVIVEI